MSVEFKGVEIAHKNKLFNKRIQICKDFTFKVNKGEILGFFGPNGSGKSTILNAIMDEVHIENGKINKKENLKIAYIPQNYNESFFSWTNLYNNLYFLKPNFYRYKKKLRKSINELKKDFKIDFDFKLKPHQCSGGMLQKTAILRSVFLDPDIILADEPFSALDISNVRYIVPVLRKFVKLKNISVIIILHNLDDLLNTCDRVIYIPDKPFTSESSNSSYKIIKHFNNSNIDREDIPDEVIESKLKYIFESK